ncbi:MAG TPA: hypothetical protein VJN70_21505 [Gemmatimonadaceae bacterium]|nr:hypothetical protein [Gemmatimonadaceae bacterium]
MSVHHIVVEAAGDIPDRALRRFRLALRSLRTLGPVLAWLRAQEPPRIIREIVTQDEYTHDVIVPWSERLVLVFDTT